MRDALADEEGPGLPAISGAGHGLVKGVRREVDRNELHMRRERSESAHDDGLLPGLGCRVVHLEYMGSFDPRNSIGAAVEARAEDHNLPHATVERLRERVVDVSRADRHRSPRTGPVSVDQ